MEKLLHNPAMVSLQGLLIGFGHIDPNEVGVVLVSFPVRQTLQQDLNETETPAGHKEYYTQPDSFKSPDESSTQV